MIIYKLILLLFLSSNLLSDEFRYYHYDKTLVKIDNNNDYKIIDKNYLDSFDNLEVSFNKFFEKSKNTFERFYQLQKTDQELEKKILPKNKFLKINSYENFDINKIYNNTQNIKISNVNKKDLESIELRYFSNNQITYLNFKELFYEDNSNNIYLFDNFEYTEKNLEYYLTRENLFFMENYFNNELVYKFYDKDKLVIQSVLDLEFDKDMVYFTIPILNNKDITFSNINTFNFRIKDTTRNYNYTEIHSCDFIFKFDHIICDLSQIREKLNSDNFKLLEFFINFKDIDDYDYDLIDKQIYLSDNIFNYDITLRNNFLYIDFSLSDIYPDYLEIFNNSNKEFIVSYDTKINYYEYVDLNKVFLYLEGNFVDTFSNLIKKKISVNDINDITFSAKLPDDFYFNFDSNNLIQNSNFKFFDFFIKNIKLYFYFIIFLLMITTFFKFLKIAILKNDTIQNLAFILFINFVLIYFYKDIFLNLSNAIYLFLNLFIFYFLFYFKVKESFFIKVNLISLFLLILVAILSNYSIIIFAILNIYFLILLMFKIAKV